MRIHVNQARSWACLMVSSIGARGFKFHQFPSLPLLTSGFPQLNVFTKKLYLQLLVLYWGIACVIERYRVRNIFSDQMIKLQPSNGHVSLTCDHYSILLEYIPPSSLSLLFQDRKIRAGWRQSSGEAFPSGEWALLMEKALSITPQWLLLPSSAEVMRGSFLDLHQNCMSFLEAKAQESGT